MGLQKLKAKVTSNLITKIQDESVNPLSPGKSQSSAHKVWIDLSCFFISLVLVCSACMMSKSLCTLIWKINYELLWG